VTGVSEPEEGSPTPARHEGRAEQHVPAYRFGIVLVLLFVTFVFLASGPTGDWVPFVSAVLQGATLLAALAAAGVSARIWRLASVVVVVTILVALGVWVADLESGTGIMLLLNALLVAVAPVVIARSLIRRRVIDLKTVMGALCIYVLLGMLWAFTFGAIAALGTEPFFAQITDATVADFLYFSFVTLTTTGYGDLTAAEGLGRAVAVLEALLGQLYLVTIVAVIVSRLARRGAAGSDQDRD
jgi:drug/metabolite transporter (DMT)-like permease